MNIAPIVLFVYNRIQHVEQTVNALRRNRLADQSNLYIYSDGPKEEEAILEIQKVRDYLHTITGFKSVTIVEREYNYGLAKSIILGVTEVVHKYGRVIVLEDDLDLSPDFLRFMNASLEHYTNNDQVMQISGHMFNLTLDAETDAVFLPFTNSIGWATWTRAWDCFDTSVHGYNELREDKALRHRFNLEGSYDYFNLLEMQINGKVQSWAIQWYLSVFIQRGIVLYPVHSLVKHIGFGTEATHCRDSGVGSIYATSCSTLDSEKINFPKTACVDYDNYKKIRYLITSQTTLSAKLKRFVKKARDYFKQGMV